MDIEQEQGISRLTFKQVQQLGNWRLQGYTIGEISAATGYAKQTLYRFFRFAIARQQLSKDCRNRHLIEKRRLQNEPLPALPQENWNTPIVTHVSAAWADKKKGLRSRPPQPLSEVRNQQLFLYWQESRSYAATARAFGLSVERARRIVIRELQRIERKCG